MTSTESDQIMIEPKSPPCELSRVDALTQQMKELLNRKDSGSENSKQELKGLAEKLSLALESPTETVERLVFYPLQASIVRVAIDLNLFNILSGDGIRTGHQLAVLTGTDHVLLARILRHIAAMGLIIQVESDSYSKNDITARLATTAAAEFFKFTFDAKSAACMALPEFLKKSKYQNTYDPNNCAFQCGHRSEYNCWEWSKNHQTAVKAFNQAVIPYVQEASWLEFYPLMTRLKAGHNLIEDEVALVNIAGGRGHECHAIRAVYPVLPGRMVLQDTVENIDRALPVKGMDAMVHDIFCPQPIQGARIYLLRNVMFKYSDADCLHILNMIIPAMAPNDSLLVINEPILLDQDASLRSTQIDLSLMACRSTILRTRGQWGRLLTSAGLEVLYTWSKFPDSDCVIEAYLAEGEARPIAHY